MAEEKTEQPTPHKLAQARKKGRVSKSTDVVIIAILAGFFALILNGYYAFVQLINYLQKNFISGLSIITKENFMALIKDALNFWFWFSLPICLALLILAILGNVLQFGFLFTSHPLKLDFKKINPVEGFKRIFSQERLIGLIKNILKFFLLISIFYYSLWINLRNILGTYNIFIHNALSITKGIFLELVYKILIVALLIAIADFFYQRFSFLRSLRMTKYEVKKEYKDQDGDPTLKQERRRRQEEMLEETSLNLDNASVLLVNPSHLAVALSYNEEVEEAPKVIAKGRGKAAQQLRNRALSLNVPILRNVPLTRDLQWLSINEEIPEQLFAPVAEVLAFVFELNQKAKVKSL